MLNKIRVGTRKSLLALVQTNIVVNKIREKFPEIEIEIVPMTTKGDQWLNQSLSSFGGKGVFTKELEEGLLRGHIDIAVHSAKDMPMELPDGLIIGGVLKRANVCDVMVTKDGTPFRDFKEGTVVGTGSLRRELQLKEINPGIIVKQIRGNVQTRLDKLADGQYDAIVLAGAGLERLNYKEDCQFDYHRFKYEFLDTEMILPAASQGILAVETRADDEEILKVLEAISDRETRLILDAERSFLKNIGGSCNAPAAALAKIEDDVMTMDAMYAPVGTTAMHRICREMSAGDGVRLGEAVAKELIALSGRKGFVYLIGAGPGDKGLMTLKGLEALKKADVVIYDNLASNSLLNEARLDAELIYAGKRAGRHYMKQDETNALLVKKALEGKTVARLKGGDPFIFGRGGEEALALLENGIEYEVIPGISSSYAVAAYNGIPVTHRTMASSFHVITGHEDAAKKESVLDYATLAKEEGTLVFLMGLKNLPNITEQLIKNGKDPKTPAAVMQEGTTARQKIAVGTLETIVGKAAEEGIKTPAISIVGDVVSLHEALRWYGKKPLSGKSVLITASDLMLRDISDRVRELGGEPLDFGLIHTTPIHGVLLKKVMAEIDTYTWMVFTSRNGVDIFFEQLKEQRIDMRRLSHIKFAVIGKGTAKALEERGIFCDCLPTMYSSKDLGEALVPVLSDGDKVLLLRAKEASKELTDILDQAGVSYKALSIYKTSVDSRKGEELNRILDYADYITFCSSSAVKAFVSMVDKEKTYKGRIVCIGPVTGKTARDMGLDVYKEASVYDIDGLISCMLKD